MTSTFDWKGQPSTIGSHFGRPRTVLKTELGQVAYSETPTHLLRKTEAKRLATASRNPTASIATPQKVKQRVRAL